MTELMIITHVILASCAFVLGELLAIKGSEKGAVEAGKAEYYLDSKYKKRWRWKP
jgi:hypothetical protein